MKSSETKTEKRSPHMTVSIYKNEEEIDHENSLEKYCHGKNESFTDFAAIFYKSTQHKYKASGRNFKV